MGELEGKIALVTGSSRGIGASCARVMAREGADVVVNYKQNREAAEGVAADVRALGRQTKIVQADVTHREQISAMVDQVLEEWPRIDILVNNAGHHFIQPYTLDTMTWERWERTVQTNLTSQLASIKAVVPGMRERGWGRIVNMSSISSQRGSGSGDVCYVASKSGVNGLARGLYALLAPFGITINTVSPGVIDTDLTRAVLSPERIPQYVARIPVGRMGSPDEIAEVVSFLCSDRAAYITGQLIAVNGGEYV
jgi:NAD(P)-dependent dehydrogenase (short-subunit alcohol dehydrogenase family)